MKADNITKHCRPVGRGRKGLLLVNRSGRWVGPHLGKPNLSWREKRGEVEYQKRGIWRKKCIGDHLKVVRIEKKKGRAESGKEGKLYGSIHWDRSGENQKCSGHHGRGRKGRNTQTHYDRN